MYIQSIELNLIYNIYVYICTYCIINVQESMHAGTQNVYAGFLSGNASRGGKI
jgi:hypothetical protein